MALHQLAENLHMTVYRLCDELSMAEFHAWQTFYQAKQSEPEAALDSPDKVAEAFGV